MPDVTIQAPGLRDLQRDLKAISRDLPKQLNAELKRIVRPLADESRVLAQRYGPKIARGIRPGVRAGVAVVRQGGRRTTGTRPDFGARQMRTVLMPPLVRHADDVARETLQVIDDVAREHGFS